MCIEALSGQSLNLSIDWNPTAFVTPVFNNPHAENSFVNI